MTLQARVARGSVQSANLHRADPFDWAEAREWTCPRCGAAQTTGDASSRCPRCGFTESDE